MRGTRCTGFEHEGLSAEQTAAVLGSRIKVENRKTATGDVRELVIAIARMQTKKSIFLDGSLVGIAIAQKALKQGQCSDTHTGVGAESGPELKLGR